MRILPSIRFSRCWISRSNRPALWSIPRLIMWEKDTVQPAPEKIVVDGSKLMAAREGQTHNLDLADYPEIGAFVESIRATLGGDLPTLRKFYTVTFQGDAQNWVLLLQPNDKTIQDMVQYIRISGAKGTIHTIETLQADGDKSEMTISPDIQ